MRKIIIWSPEQAAKELEKRLTYCFEAHRALHDEFDINERVIYNTRGDAHASSNVSVSYESKAELGSLSGVDGSSTDVGINFVFKNQRFIHSQLSANPPSVVAKPTSSDINDRRKADAADRVIRYSIRRYKLHEQFDRATWNTLTYGTGIIKAVNNPDLGEILDYDKQTGELLMEGDLQVT